MQSKIDNRFKTLKDFYCNKIVIDLTELDLTKIENVNIVNYLRNKVKNPDSEPFYLVSEDKKLIFSENYDSNKILIKFNNWIKMFPNFIKDENARREKIKEKRKKEDTLDAVVKPLESVKKTEILEKSEDNGENTLNTEKEKITEDKKEIKKEKFHRLTVRKKKFSC